MTLFIKKHQLSMSIVAIALVAITLSACGSNGGIDLSGAAQGDAETEVPVNATEEVAPPTEVPPTPIPLATGKIIFASNREGAQADLYMASPDGTEVVRLTTNAAVDGSNAPRLSPDGTKIAFSSTINNNTDIYVLDIASGIISRVTNAQEKDSSPSWSPNGQQIAFESFRDGNLEIYVVNVDGSNPTRLTNDPAGDSNPVWSPVSNDIVFSSNRFGNSDLFLLSPNGTLSTLTTNPAPDNNPAWSPDGNFIAFASFSDGLSNICIIGRDGLNQFCITPAPDQYSAPAWSPDGQWLALNNQTSIQLFSTNGDGNIIQLSQPGIEPRGVPAWSPDGLRLVFQAQLGGDMEIYHTLVPTNEFIRVTTITGYDGEPVWASR